MNRPIPVALTLVLALAACGTAPQPGADFIFIVDPLTLIVAAGGSSQANLSTVPVNGFNATVTFTLEGSVVGSGANQVAGTFTTNTTSGTLTLNVGARVAAGEYKLTVRGISGSLNRTAPLVLTVTAQPPAAPANPTGFTATAASSTSLNLSWSAVASAASYALERKTGAAAYAPIATPSGLSYADTGLNGSTTYTYRLKAINGSGSSSGVEASATTPPQASPQITGLPALCAHGVVTTITGTDFGAIQGSATVSFGGVNATQIVSWADTQIKVIVPSDSPVGSAVTVEVVTGGGTDQTTARVIEPVTLSAGFSFSLALKPDGGAVAWGANDKNQTSVPASAQSGVVSIAGNQNFALALKSNGGVIGWGDNGSGQTTIPVAATSEVMAIAAGDGHSLALKTDGSVIGWGYNYNGQATVPAVAQSGVVAVSAGGGYSLALKSDGSVVAWGTLGGVALPASVNSGVVAIESGTSHALAVKSDGSVVGWGSNTDGRITIPAGATSGAVAVSAGFNHSLVLKDDGSLLAFGNNATGQITIPSAAQTGVAAIAAGNGFSLAIKSDGSVVGWGDNVHNQITIPVGLLVAIP